MGTWTFVGHWEDDEIVVEHVVAGIYEDPREDTGYWEGGLFAASATAETEKQALHKVRMEYDFSYGEDYCSDPFNEDCMESLDDGEGFDGACGNCADRLESQGHWSHHDAKDRA